MRATEGRGLLDEPRVSRDGPQGGPCGGHRDLADRNGKTCRVRRVDRAHAVSDTRRRRCACSVRFETWFASIRRSFIRCLLRSLKRGSRDRRRSARPRPRSVWRSHCRRFGWSLKIGACRPASNARCSPCRGARWRAGRRRGRVIEGARSGRLIACCWHYDHTCGSQRSWRARWSGKMFAVGTCACPAARGIRKMWGSRFLKRYRIARCSRCSIITVVS